MLKCFSFRSNLLFFLWALPVPVPLPSTSWVFIYWVVQMAVFLSLLTKTEEGIRTRQHFSVSLGLTAWKPVDVFETKMYSLLSYSLSGCWPVTRPTSAK